MKVNLCSALIVTVALGCSSPGDGEAGGGTFGGGETSFGGQTFAGGQPSFGGQMLAGGQPSFGGQSATGGQASSGGQTYVGAGGVTSGGTAGVPTWGGGGSGGAVANGGAPQAGSSGGAGGSTSGGAGASGGTSPIDAGNANPGTYSPCPSDGSDCKILPLGDSITWGVGDEGNAGYRGPLFALAVAAGQKITFTGSLSNGPNIVSGQPFPKRNDGHSGWGISTVTQYSGGVAGIATLIPRPAFADSSGGLPNIILMMIGTNDTGDSTASAMSDRLEALMDKIIAAAPDALLVVAKITPLAWANNIINPYNDSMTGLVQTRAASGKHVVLADMNAGFTSSTMMSSDGIHPNGSGYAFMADRWYAVIGQLLPK